MIGSYRLIYTTHPNLHFMPHCPLLISAMVMSVHQDQHNQPRACQTCLLACFQRCGPKIDVLALTERTTMPITVVVRAAGQKGRRRLLRWNCGLEHVRPVEWRLHPHFLPDIAALSLGPWSLDVSMVSTKRGLALHERVNESMLSRRTTTDVNRGYLGVNVITDC